MSLRVFLFSFVLLAVGFAKTPTSLLSVDLYVDSVGNVKTTDLNWNEITYADFDDRQLKDYDRVMILMDELVRLCNATGSHIQLPPYPVTTLRYYGRVIGFINGKTDIPGVGNGLVDTSSKKTPVCHKIPGAGEAYHVVMFPTEILLMGYGLVDAPDDCIAESDGDDGWACSC